MSLKKTVHRLLAAAAALVMAFTVVTPAFAATITVSNPVAGETYTAYKLFDVSSDGSGHYSYSTDSGELKNMLSSEGAQAVGVTITFTKASNADIWYVSGLENEAESAALAKYIHTNWETLKQYLGNAHESSIETDELTGAKTVKIDTETDTGYFYVTSSLGSLCALNTVQTAETINEKNTVPSIEKFVKEDGTSGEYTNRATIDITDDVDYQLKVNTGSNLAGHGTGIDKNYEITDLLPEGFSLSEDCQLKVYVDNPTDGSWDKDIDYTTGYDPETRTLTVTLLSGGKLGEIGQDTDIYIEYTATVSEPDSVEIAENGNTNTATLEYGDQHDDADATVFTYAVTDGFVKRDGASEDKADPLAGATFVVSRDNDGKYATFSGGFLTGWVDSADAVGTALQTNDSGLITAKGLDAGTYTLEEIAAPAGYNLLKDKVIMTISEETGDVTYRYAGSPEDEAGNHLDVVDETGSELPSTGGMGTTALYAVGAVLVVGAGVTLVVRRRAHHEA